LAGDEPRAVREEALKEDDMMPIPTSEPVKFEYTPIISTLTNTPFVDGGVAWGGNMNIAAQMRGWQSSVA
jgi:hypothetical protein